MHPQIALYFPLLQFTSLYSATKQYIPLNSTILPSSAVYITVQRFKTFYVPLSSLDRHNRMPATKCFGLTGYASCLSPKILDENLRVVFRKHIFQRSYDSSDVKIQRSRVDYGFKFQTLKGRKYVLNSWVGHKKSETKSLTNVIINFVKWKIYSHFASYAKKSRH